MLPNGYPHMYHQRLTPMQIGWTLCPTNSRDASHRVYGTQTLTRTSSFIRTPMTTHLPNLNALSPPLITAGVTKFRRVHAMTSVLLMTTVTPTGKAATTVTATATLQWRQPSSTTLLHQRGSPQLQHATRHYGFSYPTLLLAHQAPLRPGGRTISSS